MPPRSATASPFLTPDDLTALSAAVADGKQPMVYLREGTPSLGLTPGTSARVLSVEGSTVTIKPRGVDDELPYEADELRMTKNVAPQPDRPTPAKPKAKAPTPAPTKPSRPTSSAKAEPTTPSPAKKTRTKKPAGKPPASVTVTIFGSPDNQWSVSVTRGGRKPTRSRSVPTDSVEKAMRGLGDAAAIEAAESVLNAAREEAQRRVEELSRELAAAQELLATLGPT